MTIIQPAPAGAMAAARSPIAVPPLGKLSRVVNTITNGNYNHACDHPLTASHKYNVLQNDAEAALTSAFNLADSGVLNGCAYGRDRAIAMLDIRILNHVLSRLAHVGGYLVMSAMLQGNLERLALRIDPLTKRRNPLTLCYEDMVYGNPVEHLRTIPGIPANLIKRHLRFGEEAIEQRHDILMSLPRLRDIVPIQAIAEKAYIPG